MTVRSMPKAAQNQVVRVDDDAVRVRVTAPPVDGRANVALIRFLASSIGEPQSSVSVISGQTSRTKRLDVRADQSAAAITKRLRAAI